MARYRKNPWQWANRAVLWYTGRMPPSQNPADEQAEKDAAVRAIVERREREMIEAKAEKIESERADAERRAAEEREFQKEVEAGRLRAEQKEEWRQAQHEKRRELERERLRKLEERRQEQLKHDAAEAKREKQKEYMHDLHRVSMFKKAAALRKQAGLDEEKALRLARDHHDTGMRDVEYRYKRDKHDIEADSRKELQHTQSLTMPPEQKKKRLEDVEIQKRQKLAALEQRFGQEKAAVERAHAAEVARAGKDKADVFAKADLIQKS